MTQHFHNSARRALRATLFAAQALWLGSPTAQAAVPGFHCDPDRCVVEAGPAMRFEAAVGATFESAGAVEMNGTVLVRTPAGVLQLLEADLRFEPNPSTPDVPFEMYGSAQAPLPALPLLAGASVHAQPMAALGLVGRDTLRSMLDDPMQGYRLPLAENPRDPAGDPNDLQEPLYLFFHFESGLALDVPLGEALGFDTTEHDPFGFSVPGDKSVTFIVDPTEPYFYLSQNAREILLDVADKAINQARQANAERAQANPDPANDPANDPNDQGSPATAGGTDPNAQGEEPQGSPWPDLGEFAFSWLGGIPFEPESNWGLPADVGHFKGQLYVETTLPLYKFVEITGSIVTYAGEHGFEQAGNGDVQVSFDLIPNVLNFSFPLGNASAGVKVTDTEQLVYFSGLNAPEFSFLPDFVPFVPANESRVAGYISVQDPTNARLYAEGQFGYDTGNLRRLTGIDLSNLMVNTAHLSIDKHGFRLRGRTSSSIHPSIQLGGSVTVDAYVSIQRPQDSYLEMTGQMLIAGVGLSPARVTVSAAGLVIEGQFVTPISSIAMTGSITAAGPSLSGAAAVVFPLGTVTDAINKARAGVIAAQQEVSRLEGLISQMRGVLQAERDRAAAELAAARAGVAAAQDQVNNLQSRINYHNGLIASYKRAISSKRSWYNKQPWYKKTWAWAVYTSYAATKSAQIAYQGTIVAGLYTAKATAQAALTVAQGVLAATEAAMVTMPIDLDPRVAGPIAAKVTALAALEAAKLALPPLPQIDADFSGNIDLGLDLGGLHGKVTAQLNGTALLDGQVVFGTQPKACIDITGLGAICAPF